MSTCRRMKLDPYHTSFTKTNSKWIRDLNAGPETIKRLQESIGENFLDIGLGNEFLEMTPEAQKTKS